MATAGYSMKFGKGYLGGSKEEPREEPMMEEGDGEEHGKPQMTHHHPDGGHTTVHEDGHEVHHATHEELMEHLRKHLPEEEQEIAQEKEGYEGEE